MSVNEELALAAARVRMLSEQIPEDHRLEVAGPWAELLDEVENTRSDGMKIVAILEWRERFEARLAAALAYTPIKIEEIA